MEASGCALDHRALAASVRDSTQDLQAAQQQPQQLGRCRPSQQMAAKQRAAEALHGSMLRGADGNSEYLPVVHGSLHLVHGEGIGRGLCHVVLALIRRDVVRRRAVPAQQP